MHSIRILWRSSVGVKALMALSGGLLLIWSALHAAGNLLVFAGPEVMNSYGAALQGSPLIWLMRGGLLAATALHVVCAVRVRREGRGRYASPLAQRASTLASRSMRATGVLFVALLPLHVLHLYGPLSPDYVSGDVHHNLRAGLSGALPALLYLAGAGVFGLHLAHGAASALRSLGAQRAGWFRAARALAAGVTGAFLLPPLAGLLGAI